MTKVIERPMSTTHVLEFIEWSKSNDTMNEAADAIQRLQYIVTVLSISSLLLLLTVIILVNR